MSEDHTKRLRSNVADLFLMNQVSAERAQSLAADAMFAGASNMADLARSGQAGGRQGDVHRDMVRACLRRGGWPPIDWAEVRVGCRFSKTTNMQRLPFLLPHEIVHGVTRRSCPQAPCQSAICQQRQGSDYSG